MNFEFSESFPKAITAEPYGISKNREIAIRLFWEIYICAEFHWNRVSDGLDIHFVPKMSW